VVVFAPEYEAVVDAAERLGVSARRVRQLVNEGQIDAVRVGSQWLVSRDSVERRAELGPSAGRRWNAEVAWGVISLLSRAGADDGVAVAPAVQRRGYECASAGCSKRSMRSSASRTWLRCSAGAR
jgi:excisionase family DNA binding protein